MTRPELIEQIIEAETVFPQRFAQRQDRPYGVIFHCAEIPDSHDGNHACIRELGDPAGAVQDTERFYLDRNLPPRFYWIGRPGRSAPLREHLRARGYRIGDQDNQFYWRSGESRIRSRAGLEIRRVTQPEGPLLEMVRSAKNTRAMRVIQRSLRSPAYHLLVGWLEARPVCMAAVERAGQICRMDDVLTVPAFRRRGLARRLIDELVAYQRRVLGGPFTLYTANPTAGRIYEEAGFEPVVPPLETWSAWQEGPGRGPCCKPG